jgi:hypothetical protein
VGYEISMTLSAAVDCPNGDFMAKLAPEQEEVKNGVGETSTVLVRRAGGEWRLRIDGASEGLAEAFASLNHLKDPNISFIAWDGWAVNSDEYVTDGLYTVEPLESSPMLLLDKAYNAIGGAAQIAISGVFATRDLRGTQAGTNLYTGGAGYARATGVISLGTSPGAIGSTVYVNWTYNGVLCKIKGGIVVSHRGLIIPSTGGRAWRIEANLVAV